jgi:hypothetical protein
MSKAKYRFILKLTCFILINSCIISQIHFYLDLKELKNIMHMFIKQISFKKLVI